MMNAQQRFLRFKLAIAGTALIGAATLAYMQDWVGIKRVTDAAGETTSYVSLPWRPDPDNAARTLIESLDRFESVDGASLEQVVGKVLEKVPADTRTRILHSEEPYLVQNAQIASDLAKYAVDKNSLSENDTLYVITQGFDNLDQTRQKEVLLDLYAKTDPETKTSFVVEELLTNPGAVAKELATGAYQEIKGTIKSAGEWTFGEDEHETLLP